MKMRKILAQSLILGMLVPFTVSAQEITLGDLENDEVSRDIAVTAGNDDFSWRVRIPISTGITVQKESSYTESVIAPLSAIVILDSQPPDTKAISVTLDPEVDLQRNNTDETYKAYYADANGRKSLSMRLAENYLQHSYDFSKYGSIRYTHLPAGTYNAVLHTNIEVKDIGSFITVDDITAYIEADTSVTSLEIPSSIEGKAIQGVDIRNLFTTYPNLTRLTIPNVENFVVTANTQMSNPENFTIDCSGGSPLFYNTNFLRNVEFENIGVNTRFHYLYYIGSQYYETCTYPDINSVDLTLFGDNIVIDSDTVMEDSVSINRSTARHLSIDRYCSLNLNNAQRLEVLDINMPYINNISYSSTLREVNLGSDVSYIGAFTFQNDTALETVTMQEGVRYIGAGAFAGCSSLQSINLPSTVEKVDPSAFADTPILDNLRSTADEHGNVYLDGFLIGNVGTSDNGTYVVPYANSGTVTSATVPTDATKLVFSEDWNNSSRHLTFAGTLPNITEIDATNVKNHLFSSFDINNLPNLQKLTARDVGLVWTNEYRHPLCNVDITLAEGATRIKDKNFNKYTTYNHETFNIPSTVTQIGEGAYGTHVFYDMGGDNEVFREFTITPGNTHYTVEDGILYTADKTGIIAIPEFKQFDNGVYEMPNTVVGAGELSFSKNPYINTLVLSDNFVVCDSDDVKADWYPNKSNSGNTLSVATYAFVNLWSYETHDSNPNYTAIDGLLYSKDGTTLIAVPHDYRGNMNIAEGCTTIAPQAFWNDSSRRVYSRVGRITLPSTMTDIDDDQLALINSLFGQGGRLVSNSDNYTVVNGQYREVQTSTILDSEITWDKSYWMNNAAIGEDNNLGRWSYAPIALAPGTYTITVEEDPNYLISDAIEPKGSWVSNLKFTAFATDGENGTQTSWWVSNSAELTFDSVCNFYITLDADGGDVRSETLTTAEKEAAEHVIIRIEKTN